MLGDAYVAWLTSEFGVGVKDYCVYWFRKAHDRLEPGKRAGLVGTNSISQNRARGASLDYIAGNGGVITSAVSKQPWPGDAVVNVSIVNWVKDPVTPPAVFALDGVEVAGVSTSLRRADRQSESALRLKENSARCFQGVTPTGAGFIITAEEASVLRGTFERSDAMIVRPYLDGDDIASDSQQRATRFVIDFGVLPLEAAMEFPAALRVVEERVRPTRSGHSNASLRRAWWRFERPRTEMREALAPLHRFAVANRYGKRILFAWADPDELPSGQVIAFAFEDDYAMGVLMSYGHIEWARAQSSTLRVDIRYTPTSAFATFPWPEPDDVGREAIADLARRVVARRQEICVERQIGLTKLYNEVDDGAYADLATLHRQLDEAVAAAYGWPKSAAHDPDESNARLLELNRAIAAGERPYDPFAYLRLASAPAESSDAPTAE